MVGELPRVCHVIAPVWQAGTNLSAFQCSALARSI